MAKRLFIAEIEAADAVSHVWIQYGRTCPRPMRPEDVTNAGLETAEFSGASRQAIMAWLERLTNSA